MRLPVTELLILLALASAVYVVASSLVAERGQALRRRLDRLERRARQAGRPASGGDADGDAADGEESPHVLEGLSRLLPQRKRLEAYVLRAGGWDRLRRILTFGTLLAALSTAGWIYVGLPLPAAILLGLLVLIGFPYLAVLRMAARRKARFLNGFPEAVDLVIRGLKAGLPVTESLRAVASEISGPAGEEFGRVVAAVGMGRSLEEALWERANALGIPEFRFLAISIAIQSETGGNLAETLSNLSGVLRSRRQLKLRVRAMSSEAKASSYIIGSLPFVMAGIIYLINSEYILHLFSDPRGHVMIALGLISFFLGATVMYKMVRFEV